MEKSIWPQALSGPRWVSDPSLLSPFAHGSYLIIGNKREFQIGKLRVHLSGALISATLIPIILTSTNSESCPQV